MDNYDGHLVVQSLALGIDHFLETIVLVPRKAG